MKYFNFDQINPVTNYLDGSSYQDQIYSIQKYFNFKILEEKNSHLQELFLFAIIVYLIYTWVKLFLKYDR